jgi:FkbM family methyltransferase
MRIFNGLHGAIRTHATLGRIALYAIPSVRWIVKIRGIGPMSINLRRNRSYWLRDPLYHESFMLGAMQQLIRPNDIVFDVGANIGLYARFMIQHFGASRVIAFEPMTLNLGLLYQNIRRGNCQDRVEVIGAALADYDGTEEFQIDDISSASGTLNVVTRGGSSEARQQYGLPPVTETVTVARLDTMVEGGFLPVPNVIKVDVEGAEERVLRGATRTLEKHSPTLAIEFHGAKETRAVVRFLLHIGYSVFGYLNTDKGKLYKEIIASDIDEITGPYSLHHCIAGRDRKVLQTPINLRL